MNPKYYRATGPRANICPWCFPHLKVTLSTADALGVLWWAMRQRAGARNE